MENLSLKILIYGKTTLQILLKKHLCDPETLYFFLSDEIQIQNFDKFRIKK